MVGWLRWGRVSTGMEVYSEEEESDHGGWDSGWVIWTRTRTRTRTSCPLGMGRVAQEEGVTHDDPCQDDPCNVLKSTGLGVASLMEELPALDDRSWFCWVVEPWVGVTLKRRGRSMQCPDVHWWVGAPWFYRRRYSDPGELE